LNFFLHLSCTVCTRKSLKLILRHPYPPNRLQVNCVSHDRSCVQAYSSHGHHHVNNKESFLLFYISPNANFLKIEADAKPLTGAAPALPLFHLLSIRDRKEDEESVFSLALTML